MGTLSRIIELEKRTGDGWHSEPIQISASTTAPTKGTTTTDRFVWRRDGPDLIGYMDYHQTAGGADGSGNYHFALPAELKADLTLIALNDGQALTAGGTIIANGLFFSSANTGQVAEALARLINERYFVIAVGGVVNDTGTANGGTMQTMGTVAFTDGTLGTNAGIQLNLIFRVPIKGWG